MVEEEKSERFLKRKIELIKEIYKNRFVLDNKYFELENIVNEIKNHVSKCNEIEQNKIEMILKEELKDVNEKYKLYILSFLLKLYKRTEYINEMLEITLNSKELIRDTKYFIFGQLNYVVSEIENIEDETSLILKSKVYEHIVDEFNKEIEKSCFIHKEERNEEFVMIFTSQMLSIGHEPTKTALDRCYSLIKKLNKKVMLINTNDLFSDKGMIPMYGTVIGNSDNSNINTISYKDTIIPFYKTKIIMPDIKEYINIVSIVKKYKPYLIFSIGDKSIISDICKQIVPTATICLGNVMPITKSDFIIPFGNYLHALDDKRIIKTKYTNIEETCNSYDIVKEKLLKCGEEDIESKDYFVEIYKEIVNNPLFK